MRRFQALVFCAAVLVLALPLAAQTGKGYPYYIQWTPVEGAGGYIVEVQNPDGVSVFSRQLGSEFRDIELNLAPGAYRFRIVTLNNFLRFENATDWANITILGQSAPVFVAISPSTVLTDEPLALTLQATRVAVAVSATLISPSGARIPLTLKKLKNDTFRLSGPSLTERGSYSLVLSNTAKLASRKETAVTAEYPVPLVARTSFGESELKISGKQFSPEAIVEILPVNGTGSPLPLEVTSRSSSLLSARVPDSALEGEWLVRIANAPDLPKEDAGIFILARALHPTDPAIAAATAAIPATVTTKPVVTASSTVTAAPVPVQPAEPTKPAAVAPKPAVTAADPVSPPPTETHTPEQTPAPAIPPAPVPVTAPAQTQEPATETADTHAQVPAAGQDAQPEAAPKEKKPLKPISHRFALGAGVNGDLLFGKWTEAYEKPTIGGYIHADFYVTNNLRPKTGSSLDFSLGLRGDFSILSNDGSARYVKSTLLGASMLFCPALTWSRPAFRVRGYLGGGLNYGYLTANDSTGTATITDASGDIAAAAGVYLEYPFNDLIACALGNQFLYVMATEPLMRNSTSLSLSFFLPVR